jgi:iron complex transport system permease protein
MAVSEARHTISEIEAPDRQRGWTATSTRLAGLVIGVLAIAVVALLSLRFGSLDIGTSDAWNGLFSYQATDYEQTIVRKLRLPRTIIAISIGGALAVAGTVMQGVTRNPLADPTILGVSQGASLGVAISITYLGFSSPGQYVWVGFAGALAAALLVFAVGTAGRGSGGPIRLALAGVVIAALLSAWTSTLLLMKEETMDGMRFWLAGSVAGRDLGVLWTVAPFLFVGVGASLLLGHQLNVLSMGDDNARALGMRTTRVRLLASVVVVLVTGAAVAVAGPIGFVGLATPHIARAIVGSDYRWILPYAFVLGAVILTAADVAGRLMARPAELQVGIVTALVGAPFLIYLARSTRMGS